MINISVDVHGLTELRKKVGAYDAASKRALDIAIKNEAVELLKELRGQVRQGTPGGHPYAAILSKLARRTKRGALRKSQVPLSRLARLLRYNIDYSSGALKITFGFVTEGPKRLAGYWQDLLRKHQEGVDVLYTHSRTELGIRMARIGARLKKDGDADARYFFLRKSTGRARGFRLPERPIIDPFWAEQRVDAMASIREKFRRKLAGERI